MCSSFASVARLIISNTFNALSNLTQLALYVNVLSASCITLCITQEHLASAKGRIVSSMHAPTGPNNLTAEAAGAIQTSGT